MKRKVIMNLEAKSSSLKGGESQDFPLPHPQLAMYPGCKAWLYYQGVVKQSSTHNAGALS